MDIGHAFDRLQWTRYWYYVCANAQISDMEYDDLEREAKLRWPWLVDAMGPGSDDAADYPVYVREGRRPGPSERAARDRGLEKLALTGL